MALTPEPPIARFQIPPTATLPQLIASLTHFFKIIVERLNTLEGVQGKNPVIRGTPDFQGNRLTNLKRSQLRSDALTRGELDDYKDEVSTLQEQVARLQKRLDNAGVG